ncbi:hypothetical protein [Brevundimonas sp.]|uniref:hypothetical protein n=1 Tax=Brevundimonas sp. TaxID=1871086 RepID=UPI002FC6367F
MSTYPDPNLGERFYEFLRGKSSRREAGYLAAARPPHWVRLVFGLILGGLTASLLVAVLWRWIPSSWAPPVWPAWSLVVVLMVAAQFVKREVYRQYGKRASRGQQDHV